MGFDIERRRMDVARQRGDGVRGINADELLKNGYPRSCPSFSPSTIQNKTAITNAASLAVRGTGDRERLEAWSPPLSRVIKQADIETVPITKWRLSRDSPPGPGGAACARSPRRPRRRRRPAGLPPRGPPGEDGRCRVPSRPPRLRSSLRPGGLAVTTWPGARPGRTGLVSPQPRSFLPPRTGSPGLRSGAVSRGAVSERVLRAPGQRPRLVTPRGAGINHSCRILP